MEIDYRKLAEDLRKVSANLRDFGDDIYQNGSTDEWFREASEKPKRVRVASLVGFHRVGDTLVHKAKKDVWSLVSKDDGGFVIEKLLDDEGGPLSI